MALGPPPVTITTGPSTHAPAPRPFRLRFNAEFVTSLAGLLTVVEMVLSIIVYALSMSATFPLSTVMLLMALSFSYWLQCAFFLLSESLSPKHPEVPATLYFLTFQALGSLLYICASIAHLACSGSSVVVFSERLIVTFSSNLMNALGAMGLIAGAAHLFHAALIIRKKIS